VLAVHRRGLEQRRNRVEFAEALLEESSDEGIVSNRRAAYLDALDDVSVERDELQLLLLRYRLLIRLRNAAPPVTNAFVPFIERFKLSSASKVSRRSLYARMQSASKPRMVWSSI
jgi:hypothetical protein